MLAIESLPSVYAFHLLNAIAKRNVEVQCSSPDYRC